MKLLSDSEIFRAAVLIAPGRRSEYLDEACAGNQPLRKEVESLLRAHDPEGSFLASPAADVTTDQPLTERPGAIIGPYKVREQIGEGGFGIVYVAEQEKPVRRKVALKIIKPGMDTKDVIARFEAERQALALMDHPNVARVLDAGATDSGRPYFVMELVQGVAITEFCDKNNLPTRERLLLFADVCRAVQHAHQKGVIHRDLKPSNIMVTLHDGKPVAKVIDFGVSKALSQHLTEKSIYTAYGQMIGTPSYMSPEQAEMSGLGIDTRSDIYSLGVLLYELLTGQTPLDAKRLRVSAYAEILRIIKEEEPPRPSLKISTLGEQATVIAQQRHTDARQLRRDLSGELDWIVMKCLEKDRNRRYETASGLARDIERYLRDEPVEACPPSALYRLNKLARKYRGLLATGATITVVLLIASVVSTSLSVWAMRAQREAEVALKKESVALEEAVKQRQVADQNFQRARDAVDTLLTKVSEGELADKPGLQPLRKELLEQVLAYYQGFIQERQDDPRLLKDLADAHYRVASITSQIGSPELAAEEYQKARAILERLVSEADPDSQGDLARLYDKFARLQKYVGNTSEAAKLHRKAIGIWTTLIERYPDLHHHQGGLASSYNDLGLLYGRLGQTDQAIDCYRQAISLRNQLAEAHPQERWFPVGYNNLALIYHQQGRYDEARSLLEGGIRILQDILQDVDSNSLHNQMQLANYYQNLSRTLSAMGQDDEALALSRKSIETEEKLVRENPEVFDWQNLLAYSYENLSKILSKAGPTEEALEFEEKSLELRTALSQNNSVVYKKPPYWAPFYLFLAERQVDAGKQTDAERSWSKAAELIRSAPEQERSAADWSCLGRALYDLGDLENAKHALEQSNLLQGGDTSANEYDPGPWYLVMTLHKLGETDLARSRFDQLSKELKQQPQAIPYQLDAAAVLGIELNGDQADMLIRTPQRNDPDYRPQLEQPTFQAGQGPRVFVDAGHHNFHTIDGRYEGFARLLSSDGYRVGGLATTFSAESLKDIDVLVIANACAAQDATGPHDSEGDATPSAFSQQEIDLLSQWVRDGGSLLLITDHKPYASAAKKLAAVFGIEMTDGYVIEEGSGPGIVFERSAGRFGQHPVFEGRNKDEQIERVVTFTGQAFRSTADLRPLLVLGEKAVRLADRVQNLPSDAERMNVEGWLQGAAGEVGQGRIAVFGEAGMFSAQLGAGNGRPMGMNAPSARQNQQFLLNVMHWLSREF